MIRKRFCDFPKTDEGRKAAKEYIENTDWRDKRVDACRTIEEYLAMLGLGSVDELTLDQIELWCTNVLQPEIEGHLCTSFFEEDMSDKEKSFLAPYLYEALKNKYWCIFFCNDEEVIDEWGDQERYKWSVVRLIAKCRDDNPPNLYFKEDGTQVYY